MRLPQPFYRLAVRFDVERLCEEIARIEPAAWVPHPNGIPGNSSVRLISVAGGDNDDVDGAMQPTYHLQQSPYIRQILASFGAVWGRSRLMRLAPGAPVPEHADINHHWFTRVRVHIPIVTRPEVIFHCGDEAVHMAEGEAWLFDNWRLHRVENPTPFERIHLVADTSGSASFWQYVADCQRNGARDTAYPYDSSRNPLLVTEQMPLAPVMPPSEVDLLVRDLRAELVPFDDSPGVSQQLPQLHALLDNFCKDWRQVYSVHGERLSGRGELRNLRDGLQAASRLASNGIVMRTNRVDAQLVLEARVLRPLLARAGILDRPVFIVAAPRSGSTMLYETLATNHNLYTMGGEAHFMIEGIPELQVGAPGVTSNRLESVHASRVVHERILDAIRETLIDSAGRKAALIPGTRLLEKTPKNSLRIPFLAKLFDDAQFIFLWREPRGNISSMIEAWRSGNWKTYNGLGAFNGPWSLILPPGWPSMNGKPIEEIAAFQWQVTNQIVLDDLSALPRERWMALSYDDFLKDPAAHSAQINHFIGVGDSEGLRQRLASTLPDSRYTDTPPADGKWQKNAALLNRVMPGAEETWKRLEALRKPSA